MKNWYKDTTEFLKYTFGDNYKLFAGLLAATSPQTMMQVNWRLSCGIYHDFMVGRSPDLSSCMWNHKPNVYRVLSGESLSGNKVCSFYRNLIGDLDAVTIDTWMLKLFRWFERGTKRIPTNNQYRKLARAFASVARNNNLKPAELQSMLWIKYREREGLKPIDYIMIGEDKRQLMLFNIYFDAPF